MKDRKQAQKRLLMLDTPVHRLIPKMALPTVIAMLITSVYSVADTYFVSFLGTSATAAVGVNSSIDNAIMMAGSFLAIGANSYISRLLGAKNEKKASGTLSTAFFCAILFGIAVAVLGLIYKKPLVVFLGAPESAVSYAMDYAQYILLAAPFMTASFVLNHCLRSEGSPFYSMVGMGIGGILNIILDPIFIFTLNLGVGGAAMATAISKLVSFCVLVFPYVSRRSLLRLSLKKMSFAPDIVKEITLMGSPSLLRIGFTVAGNVIMNKLAGAYSDSALAAVSVASRIMMLPLSAVFGFGQGFQPVSGYNWGAGNFKRVRKSYRFASLSIVAGTARISILLIIFAKPLILGFTEDDSAMVEIGRLCLISRALTLPIGAWIIVVNFLYSSMGKPGGALLIGITRQGLTFLLTSAVLNGLYGLEGLAVSQAAADILALCVAIPLALHAQKVITRCERDELPQPEAE